MARAVAALVLAITLFTSGGEISGLTFDDDSSDPQSTTAAIALIAAVVLVFGLGEVFLAWRIFLAAMVPA